MVGEGSLLHGNVYLYAGHSVYTYVYTYRTKAKVLLATGYSQRSCEYLSRLRTRLATPGTTGCKEHANDAKIS